MNLELDFIYQSLIFKEYDFLIEVSHILKIFLLVKLIFYKVVRVRKNYGLV